MKLKRLTATMLALLLVVSLLPMAAMADGLPDNEKPQANINQPIGTNSGTGVVIDSSGSVQTNTGSVRANHGTVADNNGKVADNMYGGTVENNNAGATVRYNYAGATVENNNAGAAVNNNYGLVGKKDENGNLITDGSSGNSGTVVYNMEGGIVTNNTGTVENNMAGGTVMRNSAGGTVENNNAGATVKVNHGLVGQKDENGNLITDGSYVNYGTVENNKKGGIVAYNTGTVKNNTEGGIVTNNTGFVKNNITGGTVVNNNAGYVVNNNGGTVVNNNADGAVYNNGGGKVENNSGTVYNLGGTVAINNPGGYVYYGDKESVTTNYGTHEFWDSDPSSPSPVCFYGVHFVNDQKEMVYLGDYEGSTDVTPEQLQKNCTGYKIYGILAVEDYDRDEDGFIQRGSEANESNSIPSFTIKSPTRLTLLWEKIVSVVKPASSDSGEAVPTSYNPKYIGLGSVIFINEKGYKVVEIKDDAYVVVSFDALPDEDVQDLDALFAKLFTAEQQKLIKNIGQLLSSEDVLTIFGKPGNHPVFEISKTLAE